MSQPIPRDPLNRFVAIYEALNAERSWWGDATSLRFAASAALTCPGSPPQVAQSIRSIADDLKERAGWFGSMSSSLRFIVSALISSYSDTPGGVLAEVDRVKAMFKERGLRRAGAYEMIAILVMRIQNRKAPVTIEQVGRFKAIYEEMKKHHWWLTGPDDFPACAVLTNSTERPEVIGQHIEDIYQALRTKGFSQGDPLQTAANLLYLSPERAETLATRFFDLCEGFRRAGIRMWQSDYDELAILSFLSSPASEIIQLTMRHRETMKGLKPRPDANVTFNLASGIAFLELAGKEAGHKSIADVKTLMDMQAVIVAQQAAAAAAASAAAASAASSN